MNTEQTRGSGDRRAGLSLVLLSAAVVALALLSWTMPAPRADAQEAPGATYTNPVSRGTVEEFPDPSIIKAKDGYWYAYSTYQQTPDDFIGIMRSKNLVDWEYVDSVFDSSTRPDWHFERSDDRAFMWAPDVRYLDGKYYLYYSLAQPPIPDGYFTVGVATAPTPTGPWTDAGDPVIRQGACDTFTNIDPAQFTDEDGTKYLYWGSFRNLCVAELNDEGTEMVGFAKEVYDGPAEGPYVVRRGDFYYLFVSEATCCSGSLSGYTVKVGRAKSPLGPFVDRDGVPMTDSQTKGTFVLAANGNRWVGPGHHSQFTDLSGQDWFAYHGIDRTDGTGGPEVYGGRQREMLLDRLDWIDGWPTVRAGEGASEGPQPAPVSAPTAGDDFNDGETIGQEWRRAGGSPGGWRLQTAQDAGGYARQTRSTQRPSYLVSAAPVPADARAEADLRLPARSRGAAGLVAAYRNERNYVVAWLDAGQNALVTNARVNGRTVGARRTPLPANFRFDRWHNVSAEVRGGTATFEVTDARLGDPLALQRRALPAAAAKGGSVGVAALRANAAADNVGGAPLYEPALQEPQEPDLGVPDPAFSDEFDDGVDPGSGPGSPWTWVRAPEGEESDGAFRWATDGDELFGDTDTASVLTRDAPGGDYTVETKLTFDPQEPFRQAGLIAYAGDDRYVKLVSNTTGSRAPGADYDGFHRQTEFAKEVPAGPDGFYGVMFVGPPAETMWLRLRHTVDPVNGEHEYRAYTSRDGEAWVRGGVWALPSETPPKIGLVSMNAAGATAEFDYVRTYRPDRATPDQKTPDPTGTDVPPRQRGAAQGERSE